MTKETTKLFTNFSRSMKLELQKLCLDKGISMRQALEEAIRAYLEVNR